MPAILLLPPPRTALSSSGGHDASDRTPLSKTVELRPPDTTANTTFPALHASPHPGEASPAF